MIRLDGIDALRRWRRERAPDEPIGFIPTMGALHDGHLSLVRRARADGTTAVVSVFVNPTQFEPEEDYQTYPRDLEGDAALAEAAGADLLWSDTVEALYPEGFATQVELPRLANRLCGIERPHHFGGVALVVLKLFHIVRPDRAYFGEKDYQQLVLVRRLVRDLDLEIEVVGVPVVREASGLARSSRNEGLTPGGRSTAAALSRGLRAARARFEAGERDGAVLVLAAARELDEPGISLEYLELVDPERLEPVEQVDPARGARLLVAARVERIRLIDNLAIGGTGE